MSKQSIDETKLKAIIKSAIVETLREQRELVRELIVEATEDMAMARAIEEGAATKIVDAAEVYEILDKKP
jgi:hypothetical protein